MVFDFNYVKMDHAITYENLIAHRIHFMGWVSVVSMATVKVDTGARVLVRRHRFSLSVREARGGLCPEAIAEKGGRKEEDLR